MFRTNLPVRRLLFTLGTFAVLMAGALPAEAVRVQKVVSPGGIEDTVCTRGLFGCALPAFELAVQLRYLVILLARILARRNTLYFTTLYKIRETDLAEEGMNLLTQVTPQRIIIFDQGILLSSPPFLDFFLPIQRCGNIRSLFKVN